MSVVLGPKADMNRLARPAASVANDPSRKLPVSALEETLAAMVAAGQVMPEKSRSWTWVALLVDVDPDDLKHYECDFPALLYVDPEEYRPGFRKARQAYFRLPGKYRNKDRAWDALEEMMASH
jgi:hypothetical protein